MKIKIVAIENKKTVFYTIEDERNQNLYEMDVTLQMVEASNEKCTITHIGEATIGKQIINTVASFHKLRGSEMKIPDLFRLAEDPNKAPLVRTVYEIRRKAPLGPNQDYAFIPAFSRN